MTDPLYCPCGQCRDSLPREGKSMTECERSDYEERAAILEFEAGMTRAEAEAMAWAAVVKARACVAGDGGPTQ